MRKDRQTGNHPRQTGAPPENHRSMPGSERDLIRSAELEAEALLAHRTDDLPRADSIPGFRILGEVGRGGMGVVYKALQLSTNRTVALKVMLAGPFASPAARQRFKREVELAARFQHPAIVRVLESGETATGQPYYAMDYIHGMRLDRWLGGVSPGLPERLPVFLELCAAIEHAHRQGVIHRDLKPANILVDTEGHPHVLDFGLSKAIEQTDGWESLTLSNAGADHVMGTLAYLSPEQATGAVEEVDPRTDVYALGVMLYQSVTGSFPHDIHGSHTEVIRRICEDDPEPVRTLAPNVDSELETIVLKALQKEKGLRYRTAADLGDDLRRYLQGEPILARPNSSFYVIRKKLLKHRLQVTAVVVVAALIPLCLWGGVWWQDRVAQNERTHDYREARREVLAIQNDIEAGRVEYALGPAHALYDRYPDLAEAVLVWSQAQFRLGRRADGAEGWVDTAFKTLRTAIANDVAPHACRTLLDEMRGRIGIASAPDREPQSCTGLPDNAETSYLLSFATLDLDRAAALTENAVDLDPEHSLAWARLARLSLLTERPDRALRTSEEWLRFNARPAAGIMLRAKALVRHGEYREAVNLCTQAITASRRPVAAYRLRALAHLCLREYEESAADYSTVVEFDGTERIWGSYKRATALWALGRLDEAAADYRTVREIRGHPTFADARLFLVLSDQKRLAAEADIVLQEEASEVLRNAQRGAVRGGWLDRILSCLAGELPPAELVKSANLANPEQVCESYYYAAEACLLRGEIGEARDWFRKCVQTGVVLDPDSAQLDPMNEYHLARWRLDSLPTTEAEGATPSESHHPDLSTTRHATNTSR